MKKNWIILSIIIMELILITGCQHFSTFDEAVANLDTPSKTLAYMRSQFTWVEHYGLMSYSPQQFFKRKSGACYDHATFFSYILAQHGYYSEMIHFTYYEGRNRKNHMVTIYKDTNGVFRYQSNSDGYGPVSSVEEVLDKEAKRLRPTRMDRFSVLPAGAMNVDSYPEYEVSDILKTDAGNSTDQALLAKIAVQDEDYDVRRAAVVKLTDQALLAKIVIQDKDSGVRRIVAAKLTDQALLAKIAVQDKDWDVRRIAAGKLNDSTLLSKIAIETEDEDIRRIAAVKQLTDQSAIALVAESDSYPVVRKAAVEQLTDQTLLAKIAVQDKDWLVRRTAAKRLAEIQQKTE